MKGGIIYALCIALLIGVALLPIATAIADTNTTASNQDSISYPPKIDKVQGLLWTEILKERRDGKLAVTAQVIEALSVPVTKTRVLINLKVDLLNDVERERALLDIEGYGASNIDVYKYVNAIGTDFPIDKLDELASLDYVESILDADAQIFEAKLDTSVPMVMGGELASLGLDGSGVNVAVLDTGIRHNTSLITIAEDAAGNLLQYSAFDESTTNESTEDYDGHGTHVAGIIAAHRHQYGGIWLQGVAPGAEIVPVKVLDGTGSGSPEVVTKGINWATGQTVDIDIIQMSLGSKLPDNYPAYWTNDNPRIEEMAAVGNAVDRGITVVISSGNEADNHASFQLDKGTSIDIGVEPENNYAVTLYTQGLSDEFNVHVIDPDGKIVATHLKSPLSYKLKFDVIVPQDQLYDEWTIRVIKPLISLGGKQFDLIVKNATVTSNRESYHTITIPGNVEKAITVGAVDDNGMIAEFSSCGPTRDGRIKPDIVAPGVAIKSIINSFSVDTQSTDTTGFTSLPPNYHSSGNRHAGSFNWDYVPYDLAKVVVYDSTPDSIDQWNTAIFDTDNDGDFGDLPGSCPACQVMGIFKGGNLANHPVYILENIKLDGSEITITKFDDVEGTSQAAPHVSGASALLIQFYREQYNRDPSPDEIKAILMESAVDSSGNPRDTIDNVYGAGRLNIYNAIHYIKEIPIKKGLQYLRTTQSPDGSWHSDVGMTSLAVLSFLNYGYDETDPDVQDAIGFIRSNIKTSGIDNGAIYNNNYQKTYHTSLAVLALVATHNEDDYLTEINAARDWLVKVQWGGENSIVGKVNTNDYRYGGFGYGTSPANPRPDLSNTQFALMALDAADLPKTDPVWTKAQVFLNRTQVRDESNDQPWANGRNSGGFVYTPDGGTAGGGPTDGYGSMTAAGIWCLRLCDVDKDDDPRLQAALNWFKTDNHYTWNNNPGMPEGRSYLYYYYLTFAKALLMTVGAEPFDGHDWYGDLSAKLIDLQHPDGHWVNTYSGGNENIPGLTTSYALLALETRTIPTNIGRLSYLTFILHSNADLHVYDPLGRHVGMNYTTGHIEMQIPGAVYHSNPQNITFRGLDAGDYKVRMVGTSNGEYTLDVICGLKDKILEHETYTNTITTGVAHDATVNAAMLTGLSFHIEEPEICVPCRITQVTSDASMQDRPSIVYANNNFYVAYQSWETGYSYNGDIFVKKFNPDWNEVKKIQITNDQSYQDSPSLVFANNKYDVVYASNETGNWDIFVKQYDLNWNYVKKIQLTTLSSTQDLPSVIYANNNFYVAYQSWETGYSYHGDIFVKKFDSNWNYISKIQVTSRTSYQDRPSLLFANNHYYVAYMSEETGDLDIFVKEYDSNWNYLQKRQITSESSSQSFPSLVFADNKYALAYASNELGNLDIFVKHYDSSWNFLKKIQSTDKTSHQRRPSLVFADNDFYVAYVSDETGDWDIFSRTAECTEICGNGIDDDGDGFADEDCNHAPNVLITTPSGTQSENILISYTLTDTESDTCTLSSVQYSQDSFIWHDATMGSGGDGTTGLTSSPTGVAHTYAWASATDLPDIDDSTMYFRIKANDGAIDGVYGESNAFHVDNVVTSTFQIQVHTGWNLISIPLVPEDTNIDSIFSSIAGNYSVVWTTTSTGGWKSSNQAFGKLTDITVDKGYLIYMTAPDTLVIEGTEPTSTTIDLVSGWNLVGYPSQTTRSITDVMSGVSYDVVWTTTSTGGWKSSNQAFGKLTDMSQGNGYMVYAPVSGSYTVS